MLVSNGAKLSWWPRIQASGTGLALVSTLAPTIWELPYSVRILGLCLGALLLCWPLLDFVAQRIHRGHELLTTLGLGFILCGVLTWYNQSLYVPFHYACDEAPTATDFYYIWQELDAKRDDNDRAHYWIRNLGNKSFESVGWHFSKPGSYLHPDSDPGYWVYNGYAPMFAMNVEGGAQRLISIPIPPGNYTVEMSDKANHVHEELEIKRNAVGQYAISAEVTRDGQMLLRRECRQ
jgi:hypothetical protein